MGKNKNAERNVQRFNVGYLVRIRTLVETFRAFSPTARRQGNKMAREEGFEPTQASRFLIQSQRCYQLHYSLITWLPHDPFEPQDIKNLAWTDEFPRPPM